MPSVFGAFRGASMVRSFITTLLINKQKKLASSVLGLSRVKNEEAFPVRKWRKNVLTAW
jgi:hypothetical protein